jgi:ubiquinone/menaquinone biosynthesis C-methylase UbiE
MFTESAEFYDLIYTHIKNYETEAKKIAALIEKYQPKAQKILDVACGTGEHARILSKEHGFKVDGIDIDNQFIQIAKKKIPGGDFMQADMMDFDLGKKYDVAICLFSSIGYVKSLDNVKKTLVCLRRHLSNKGLLLIEPWITPDAWEPGKVIMHTVEDRTMKICRMSHSSVNGKVSELLFEYLIGESEGIHRKTEVHKLGLFTVEEMKSCLREAGFKVIFDPQEFSDRGLYIAKMAE